MTILFPGSDNMYFSVGDRWQTSTGYLLIFMPNGDLQLFDYRAVKIWASETGSMGAARLHVQSDGNVVIYDNFSTPIWATQTDGNVGAHLALQSDGNLVVYSRQGTALWTSGTAEQ